RQYETRRPAVHPDACRLAERLRGSLDAAEKMILLTGAALGEGVSSSAYQLAMGLAMLDEGHVLLVDANFHAPSLEEGIRRAAASPPVVAAPMPGLSELIQQRADFADSLYPTAFRALSLLPT